MYLVQLLLPLRDNEGRPFPRGPYAGVRAELTKRFGGLTAYTRAPAEGVWTEGDGSRARDDIVVYEVMVEELDREWWKVFRALLERLFAQQELIIRAHPVERL